MSQLNKLLKQCDLLSPKEKYQIEQGIRLRYCAGRVRRLRLWELHYLGKYREADEYWQQNWPTRSQRKYFFKILLRNNEIKAKPEIHVRCKGCNYVFDFEGKLLDAVCPICADIHVAYEPRSIPAS